MKKPEIRELSPPTMNWVTIDPGCVLRRMVESMPEPMRTLPVFKVTDLSLNVPGPTLTVSHGLAASMASFTESVAVAHEVYGGMFNPVLET